MRLTQNLLNFDFRYIIISSESNEIQQKIRRYEMGFFDSFKSGAKDVFKGYDKVKLKEKITYDELYEIMKDETYSVGKPEITGSGLMRSIQFPAVDKYKIQIAITSKTITISKIYSGAGGLAKEIIGDAFTNGMYDIVNEENIDLNRATREVGEKLKVLLEKRGLA